MSGGIRSWFSEATQGRWLVLLAVLATALTGLTLFAALHYLSPAPPRQIAITTGGETGAYYAFGKRYAAVLGRNGVQLDVKTSAGSIENLQRLANPSAEVAAGLLQGGIGNGRDAPDLLSLGRVFLEPLWVFYRSDAAIERLSQFKGKRLAVGPEGSGTRKLVETLLDSNQLHADGAMYLPITNQVAADALLADQADAIFLVLAPEAPLVQSLIRSPGVRLMSFSQAEAYTKLFPYLSRLVLPAGAFSLADNIPANDVTLVAPTAALVVRNDLHPAVVALLAEAAQEVHGKAGLFAKAGEFPKTSDPDFEMSADAQRYYKDGVPFLRRFMPFWVAILAQRMIVLLVPLLTVAFPVAKLAPVIYRWQIRRKLLYWYGLLRRLETRIAELPAGRSAADIQNELDKVDQAIRVVKAPVGFAEQFYNLRSHVELVRQRLLARIA